MAGYIGVTANEWFNNLSQRAKSHSLSGEINFWRKDKRPFKAIRSGEPFYFLVKNEKYEKGERKLKGCATFVRSETKTIDAAWNDYKINNGDSTEQEFRARLRNMYQNEMSEIGCIILRDLIVFENPILLSELEIPFQNAIISGKSINEFDVAKITNASSNNRVKELVEDYLLTFYNEVSFPEGEIAYVMHAKRERNRTLIKMAKQNFLEIHGKIFCEVCEFDFKEQYGEVGENYIECHHTKPISEMKEGDETKVSDVILVCSNCHSMIHRKKPWLTKDELKSIVNTKYKINNI